MRWKIISLILHINIKMVLMQGYTEMENAYKSRKKGVKDDILVTQHLSPTEHVVCPHANLHLIFLNCVIRSSSSENYMSVN